MNRQIKKILVVLALTGYMFLAVFSLAILPFHMHANMPGGPCPYSSATHSVCSMDLFGHLSAWTKTVQTLLPYIAVLIISFWLCSIKTSVGSTLLKNRRQGPVRQYSPYVSLFSTGILNPKVP